MLRTALHRITLLIVALPAMSAAQGIIVPPPCRPAGCTPVVSVVHESSRAEVQLRNGVLEYVITETLRNRGSANAEVDYVFPLPRMAAFQNLAMSVDGEMLAGEILPAEQARAFYEAIVRANRDPALVEWMGHGVLRTRIFPIMPGEEKTVQVRLQAVAEREGDAIRVDYKMGTRRATGTAAGSPTTAMRFTFPDSARYGEPYSPTHSTTRLQVPPGQRGVEISGTTSELTLLLPVRRSNSASISVISHARPTEQGFALMTLTPPDITRRRTTPRDVVFVVDISGSMAGRKLQQARDAGRQLLSTLGPQDRFRIVTFSSDVSWMDRELIAATPANVRRAHDYLDALEASGGTNIMAALEEALRQTDGSARSRLPVVLFVTDGAPTAGETDAARIARRGAELRRDARIFSFGVGTDVRAELIEQLAVEGRGTAHIVLADESVERSVSLVAARLQAPLITDLSVSVTGATINRVHPRELTDVFEGQDVVLLARYSGSGVATLRFDGTTADGPVSWTTTVTLPSNEVNNRFVARLWATQRVGFLTTERRRNGPSQELDDEIRALGEEYSIPTPFTSYMVVEPGVQFPAGGVGRGGGGGGRGGAGGAVGDRASFTIGASSDVRARGGSAAEPGAQPPNSRALTAHESVQLNEVLRNAKSEAEVAAILGGRNAARVGDRVFAYADSTWVDTRSASVDSVVKIKAFSEGYFDVLKALPSLAPVFALGDRVIVAGKAIRLELHPDGTERLSAQELDRIVKNW